MRKILPALKFRAVKKHTFDIIHYHGDDYLSRGSCNRVRTFYGSSFYEAIFAAKIPRFFYHALFYLLELISCTRKGCKVGISKMTCRVLPGVMPVISCGVPLNKYCPGTKKTAIPTLLFIGDMWSRKRGRDVIGAFNSIREDIFPEAMLTVVGPEQITGENIICKIGLSEEELIEEYRKSWVYCMTSSYEGFGVPMVEAMACGTAVVARNIAGAREIVAHNYNGLLYHKDSFRDILVRVLSDQHLRTRLVRNGLKTAAKYDIQQTAQEYLQLYESIRLETA
ncbi:MAG: glycosyltransferase [Chitinivibrionales bacterium]|nr:glycosyltransferase [Chitinivibrionales bacterium]